MRLVLPTDWPVIEERLLHMKARSPAPQMRHAEIGYAMAALRARADSSQVVINDGYMILFDVGSPWYTKERFLIEELILRIGPSTDGVRGAIRCLDKLARLHECCAVAAGDTQVGYMVPHYEAEGFRVLGQQLFKEIEHGVRP